jgi:hypothetical protein
MKRYYGSILSAFVLILALMVSACQPVQPLDASQIEVTGTASFVGPPDERNVATRSNTCHLEVHTSKQFEGTIEGMAPMVLNIVVNHFCDGMPPDTYAHQWVASGTFTGTVDSVPGAFDFAYVAQIEAGGELNGKFIIIEGAGGLANLRGIINETGPLLGTTSYSGQLSFGQ